MKDFLNGLLRIDEKENARVSAAIKTPLSERPESGRKCVFFLLLFQLF